MNREPVSFRPLVNMLKNRVQQQDDYDFPSFGHTSRYVSVEDIFEE